MASGMATCGQDSVDGEFPKTSGLPLLTAKSCFPYYGDSQKRTANFRSPYSTPTGQLKMGPLQSQLEGLAESRLLAESARYLKKS